MSVTACGDIPSRGGDRAAGRRAASSSLGRSPRGARRSRRNGIENKREPARLFVLVFVSVLGLTVLSLAVSLYLTTHFASPSEEIKRLTETCSTTWKLGFGAVISLITGKVLLELLRGGPPRA
jgi:hypothetical protein